MGVLDASSSESNPWHSGSGVRGSSAAGGGAWQPLHPPARSSLSNAGRRTTGRSRLRRAVHLRRRRPRGDVTSSGPTERWPARRCLGTTCKIGAGYAAGIDQTSAGCRISRTNELGVAELLLRRVASEVSRSRSGWMCTALRAALDDWMIDEQVPRQRIGAAHEAPGKARSGCRPWSIDAIVHGYEVDFLVIGTPIRSRSAMAGAPTTRATPGCNFERDRIGACAVPLSVGRGWHRCPHSPVTSVTRQD